MKDASEIRVRRTLDIRAKRKEDPVLQSRISDREKILYMLINFESEAKNVLIRNIMDIEKIWTEEHGKGTLYQVFFGMCSTHEVVGIPSKRFAVAKRITSFWS